MRRVLEASPNAAPSVPQRPSSQAPPRRLGGHASAVGSPPNGRTVGGRPAATAIDGVAGCVDEIDQNVPSPVQTRFPSGDCRRIAAPATEPAGMAAWTVGLASGDLRRSNRQVAGVEHPIVARVAVRRCAKHGRRLAISGAKSSLDVPWPGAKTGSPARPGWSHRESARWGRVRVTGTDRRERTPSNTALRGRG